MGTVSLRNVDGRFDSGRVSMRELTYLAIAPIEAEIRWYRATTDVFLGIDPIYNPLYVRRIKTLKEDNKYLDEKIAFEYSQAELIEAAKKVKF